MRSAADRLSCGTDSITPAYNQLIDRGFIVLTGGHIYTEGKARTWRLTFESTSGREPTDDWKFWGSQKSPDRISRTERPDNLDGSRQKLPSERRTSVWSEAARLENQ